MSENLGEKLPENTFTFLKYSNEKRKNSAIFLLTVDEESYPHVALLSSYQVVARNPSELVVAVHSTSKSCSYLDKNGRGTLILQLSPAVQYIKCLFRELTEEEAGTVGSGEKLFSVTIAEVLQDYSDKAPFVSELLFDEKNTFKPYSEGFKKIKSIIGKMEE